MFSPVLVWILEESQFFRQLRWIVPIVPLHLQGENNGSSSGSSSSDKQILHTFLEEDLLDTYLAISSLSSLSNEIPVFFHFGVRLPSQFYSSIKDRIWSSASFKCFFLSFFCFIPPELIRVTINLTLPNLTTSPTLSQYPRSQEPSTELKPSLRTIQFCKKGDSCMFCMVKLNGW